MADYITVAEADAYAVVALRPDAWLNQSSQQKAAAIDQATRDIDSVRWHGRKAVSTQEREFPRLVESSAGTHYIDWDSGTSTAIVPTVVKRACFEQALYRLTDCARQGRVDAIQDGLAAQSAGGVSEVYRDTARGSERILCPEAARLLKRFVLRGGAIV